MTTKESIIQEALELFREKYINDDLSGGVYCQKHKAFATMFELADSLESSLSTAIDQTLEAERKDWIASKRCTSCGNEKEDNMADWCSKCFQEN